MSPYMETAYEGLGTVSSGKNSATQSGKWSAYRLALTVRLLAFFSTRNMRIPLQLRTLREL